MLTRLWKLCCSLKVTIVLASLATAVAIAGSLLIHFNPQTFAGLDALSFTDWHNRFGQKRPILTGWFYLTGALIILLAFNTLCCFIDWLRLLRSRWRKSGEYLIHLGFVLIVIAYFWGSFAGDRFAGLQLTTGQRQPIPFNNGYFLRLDNIEPVLGSSGLPVDVRHLVTLLHGDNVQKTISLQANTPLWVNNTCIVASGSGQSVYGYRVVLPDLGGSASLIAGGVLPLLDGKQLRIDEVVVDGPPQAPLLHLTLMDAGTVTWSGWYSMRASLPKPLQEAGFRHIVRNPLQRPYSQLTVNHDPGWRLALVGGSLLSCGVIIALFSFYAKRRRGDRPDIA